MDDLGIACSFGCSDRGPDRGPLTEARALSCRFRGVGAVETVPVGEYTLLVVLLEAAGGGVVVPC
jgi:hypothetical protein